MSFSSEIKENLSKMMSLKNKELVKYELMGYLISNNTTCKKKTICYSTGNEYNINRFSKLLSNKDLLDFQIGLKGKKYQIMLPKIETISEIHYEEQKILFTEKCIEDLEKESQNVQEELEKKALIRGIFLGSGSVNNPENTYHLEIILAATENVQTIKVILEQANIHVKEMKRKSGISLYLKDGEEISKFLAFIGANAAVLKFEEIRVLRDMKNTINRKVNCETANLNKTIGAAVKQIEAIKNLQREGKFENLPDSLKEIALLRLENPDASLLELGQMLKNPIGKSGVNHRLKQIEQMLH